MAKMNFEDSSVFVTRTARKTISMQIKSDGIHVRAPLRMSDA